MKKALAVLSFILILTGTANADFRRGSGFNQGDLTIDKNSVDFDERDSNPSTPATNRIKLFAKDNGGTTTLYTIDSSGSATAVGTGVGLASTDIDTSAELDTIVTDNTGSGVLVFATSPTLVTPVLGVAAATTLDTGQGANELYNMDQNVLTTSSPTFAALTLGASSGFVITDTNALVTVVAMADDQVLVANGATTAVAKTLVDCDDTAGNHLNYDTATNTFSCGISSSGAGGWSDGGTDITLSTSTDNVGIGGASLGKFSVDGVDDEAQLVVQGHSTQTSNIVVFEKSDGTDLFALSNTGAITTGLTGSNSSISFGSITMTDDQDGAFTIAANGDGSDENLILNLDDTSNTGVFTSGTGLNNLTFTSIDLTVPTEVYDATGWNGDNTVPTKDAVRDKIETLGGGGGPTGFNLPIYSAKLSGAFVVFTPPTGDACSAGAQLDAAQGNWRLLFDATTDECATWQFVIPDNYVSTPILNVQFSMVSGEANEVEWEAAIMCNTPGDTADIGTASFSNVAVGTATTVAATAGRVYQQAITITDDSCAAGDTAFIVLSTDADDATNDDATGDRELVGLEFQYS